jgi:Polyketide cyclase / dehydrase and lipid transport
VSNDYEFVTVWRVAGTIEEVKAVLGDADPAVLPRWWPSVYLTTRLVAEGEPDGVGREVELYTKGWLPYTLRWTLRVTEPITDSGYSLSANGDLDGTGVWTFKPDGPEVEITYDWRISATKPLLRRLTWLLRPAFSANHHWAMKKGEESLQLELRRRRATTDAEREQVPPPPPATFRGLTR